MSTVPAPVAVTALGRRFTVPAAVPPVVVAGAAGAVCLVVRLVDPSGSRGLLPCPFRAVTGLDCPGCGSTRALHHLLNGRLATAVGFNAMFVAAVPVLVGLWLAWALPSFTGRRRPAAENGRRRLSPAVVWTALGAVVLFAVVRNLPLDPFRALGTD